MLHAESLAGGYGPVKVLHDINISVGESEVVALVGRNGMGKTTTVRMLTGALPLGGGTIEFAGRSLEGLADFRISRLGMGLVPEGRQIFHNLTVEEHLILAQRSGAGASLWTRERIYRLFPRLQERRAQLANTLSGGEQQMLAIGRALVTAPRLLILDEATEGLAPLVRKEIWVCLETIAHEGLSVLVVDKDIAALSRIATRVVVVAKGKTVWEGSASAFAVAPEVHQLHLGV
ncbi:MULTISPECIES: ABC transporter ATP-binding protein [Rhizobium/Agrobacterium group]|uniref:ABC transporter ATP-binding protein n=1 Tax=Rhizobium/Agrobacterium group TaxID=227290 RepID=UPI001C5B41D7|nr:MULTISPECIES: ABC transporter ATP-binding protein [Rhizobium/Agrobacterium group]QXZ76615.1 ABC transporter ATP-binding protein [Agrobacterium sp. S7/73]QYA17352.1 ABC transporter ATP-binding protein [Rhizobium sp. AB2/73]UEQ85655.1 ABC transporter ATP-binding protein [Rhizobium sp. AB2/73]